MMEICRKSLCVSEVLPGTWYTSASASGNCCSPILPWQWYADGESSKAVGNFNVMSVNGSLQRHYGPAIASVGTGRMNCH